MPREKQKRGRRAEAKRKREDEEPEPATKKQKPSENQSFSQAEIGDDYIPLEDYDTSANTGDTPFYGLLDSEEQDYFSHANGLLDLDQFDSLEEKGLFVERVFEEANGKELKIACSQSCSRLMEKLIALSTPSQAKRLFSKFSGHILHLVQHRFASHCCEALFVRSAGIATQEKKSANKAKKQKRQNDGDDDNEEDSIVSVEELYLNAVSELDGNWGYLLTERFASHTIRVLLLVLAGEPFDSSFNAVIASRKKENLDSTRTIQQQDGSGSAKRPVPESFNTTLDKMMGDLISGLDNTYLRALATHPTGSPVLQVILSLELTRKGKSNIKDSDSLFAKLVPDEGLSEGSESAAFLRGLLYDPVGSRLLETIVRCAPGKIFKSFFKNIIHERIGSLSRNDTASYVVVRVLERLSKEDLISARDTILPEITALVERSRLIVIKALIERSVIRGADTAPLAESLKSAYGDDPVLRLKNILKIQEEGDQNKEVSDSKPFNKSGHSPEQTHGSLLAQEMLKAPGPLSELILSSFLAAQQDTIVSIAKHPTASRVLQDALGNPKSAIQFRRQLAPRFFGIMAELALDASGSHVADVLWDATKDLMFVKQRLADELSENERTLRDSFFGRAVWRNWSMDLYKRRRGEWKAKAKGLADGSQQLDKNNTNGGGHVNERPKSKIELARARFAAKADEHHKSKNGPAKESGRVGVTANS